MKVYDLINYLCYPDCRGDLIQRSENLLCVKCNREYKVYNDICVELLPSKMFFRVGKNEVEIRAIDSYKKIFGEPFIWKDNPSLWGLDIPEKYVNKFKKHKHVLYKLIPEKIKMSIDVSAGSGRFSYSLIDRANIMVFCDLSVDSCVYLSQKIEKEGVKNALVVRCDYLSIPFKDKIFDLVLCNDTLIYGYEHEIKLISSIYKILSPDGIAILDFANKYHHLFLGFWHKPYTVGYSKKEMENMLRKIGFSNMEALPLYYDLAKDLDEQSILSRIIKIILPPTRYIWKVEK
ncbi:class I SAM-dependent methyltransferase [Caldisericum sp.]|uniref:class I SAM-dependent methyltransferase n=1 Tax=Caldisericum sp. TaxID=2499687 RepID=UPI003D0C3A8E